jgi:hypothetical protein
MALAKKPVLAADAQAPAGKEKNWTPTKAGGEFEVLFRFYGPEKALFEKTWALPDFEKLS